MSFSTIIQTRVTEENSVPVEQEKMETQSVVWYLEALSNDTGGSVIFVNRIDLGIKSCGINVAAE